MNARAVQVRSASRCDIRVACDARAASVAQDGAR